jgi:NADH:ubiquinone oxidoreductase subunit 4 (subunit M)
MILAWLILIPLMGGLAAWPSGSKYSDWSPMVIARLSRPCGSASVLYCPSAEAALDRSAVYRIQPPRSQLGINLHLAVDGLSSALVALTVFLGIIP